MSDRLIRLSWRELAIAADVGCQRRIRSMAEGLNDAYGYNGEGDIWTREVNGAAAEMAVAKFFNRYWEAGVNTFKAPDVEGVQVRHTTREDGCLIIREHDPPDELYVLVIGAPPTFRIAGALYGRQAKRPEWLRDPGGVRPAYFVPQDALEEAA